MGWHPGANWLEAGDRGKEEGALLRGARPCRGWRGPRGCWTPAGGRRGGASLGGRHLPVRAGPCRQRGG
eukprot:101216-Lingulodinium_polyedra.AAC.1